MSISKRDGNRTQRHNKRYLIILAVLMMALIVATASARSVDPVDFEVVNGPSFWLDGPAKAVPDETLSYDITTDAVNIYGAQLEISFDPAVLQVIEDEVTPGICPTPQFIAQNTVDNVNGSISYAATSLSPTPPCDGGIVASFHFQVSPAAAEGITQVQFHDVILSDSDGTQIPVTVVDLDLEIIGGELYKNLLPITILN